MIHPRVLFTGDPAAATPWVGIAKKLARACYNLKIVSKVYQLESDVKITVRNLFPIAGKLGGICKVLIEVGGETLLLSVYPKNSDNPYGWNINGNPALYSGYQVGVSTDYRLWGLYSQRLYKKKDLPSLRQQSNQFYLSSDKINISFYPGPQSDCPVLVYYAGSSVSGGKYRFRQSILQRIYEPFILFAGANPPGGYPAAISQNAIISYPLRSSYNAGYVDIGSLNFYLVTFVSGRNIVLGCFKNGNIVYRIEAIPFMGISTSYVTVYFKYYIGDDIIQTITLRTLYYNQNPDLFPYKFNSVGTKFSHVVYTAVGPIAKYQAVEYSINFGEEGEIILTNSVIDESYYEYSFSMSSSGNGSSGASTSTGTTTGTSPFSVFYDNYDDLKIALISFSTGSNSTVNYNSTGRSWNHVYEYGQLKSYDYESERTFTDTNTTTTEINIVVGGNSYSISDYTNTITKTVHNTGNGHGAYFGEYKSFYEMHTETKTTQKDGYYGTLLAADAKNHEFFITRYDLQTNHIGTSEYEEEGFTPWIVVDGTGFYGTPVITTTLSSAGSKTESHQVFIRQNDINIFSSNDISFTYSSSDSSYSDLVNEYCPSNESLSESYETSSPTLHGLDFNILAKDTFTRAGISYAGVNLASGYHYIANIVGICPNGFASGIDPIPNSFLDINVISSSISNLQSNLPLSDVTIYPVSLYYSDYENLNPTPYE